MMDEETQTRLLDAAKKALKVVAVTGKHEELVYELRDLIRKVENGPSSPV